MLLQVSTKTHDSRFEFLASDDFVSEMEKAILKRKLM
jgi:hypothetical protein